MNVINPYDGVDFTRIVKSITHEHITNYLRWANAYNRGIRHFGSVSYQPSAPHFPASNYWYKVIDGIPVPQTYQDFADLPNQDYTVVNKELTGSVKTFEDSEGNTINTDDLPQVPNNEHPTFTKEIGVTTSFLNHFNVLGNMWGESGWGKGNGTISDRVGHPLCDLSDMAKFLDEENQYFKGKIFGTINHCKSLSGAKTLLNSDFSKMPLGFEVFNQGYTRPYNQQIRDCYDALLKEGYRLFAVSVVDWQGDIERGGADDDYVKEADYDRGCNVLLVEDDYDSLPANDFIEIEGKKYPNYHSLTRTKAEAGLDCYISGRFYASGLGNHLINELLENNGIISFSVDGSPSSMYLITNIGRTEIIGNTVKYAIEKGVTYVRFEVYYDNDEYKDFIITNPIWVEDHEDNNDKQKTKKNLLLIY